jgi:hypothetical protein
MDRLNQMRDWKDKKLEELEVQPKEASFQYRPILLGTLLLPSKRIAALLQGTGSKARNLLDHLQSQYKSTKMIQRGYVDGAVSDHV